MYLMPNIVRALFSHPNLHNLCEIFTKSGQYNSETICTRTANNTTFPHNLKPKNPFMMFILRFKVIAGVKIEVKVKYIKHGADICTMYNTIDTMRYYFVRNI